MVIFSLVSKCKCKKYMDRLSLGFRVGKFRDSGLLYNVYSFFLCEFIYKRKNQMSLGFRVGKFCDSGTLYNIYSFFRCKFY